MKVFIFNSKGDFTPHIVKASNEDFKIKTKNSNGEKVQQIYFVRHNKIKYTSQSIWWFPFVSKKIPCSFYNENNPEPLSHEFVSSMLSGEDWNKIMDSHVISELFKPQMKSWILVVALILAGLNILLTAVILMKMFGIFDKATGG